MKKISVILGAIYVTIRLILRLLSETSGGDKLMGLFFAGYFALLTLYLISEALAPYTSKKYQHFLVRNQKMIYYINILIWLLFIAAISAIYRPVGNVYPFLRLFTMIISVLGIFVLLFRIYIFIKVEGGLKKTELKMNSFRLSYQNHQPRFLIFLSKNCCFLI